MMKSTGIVRKIDNLGRIVLPKELRDNLNIESSDSVEVYVNKDMIVLKKYAPEKEDNKRKIAEIVTASDIDKDGRKEIMGLLKHI